MLSHDFEEESEILKALANPTRLRLLMCLLDVECNVSNLQKKLGIPQSTVSQHIRVLRNKKIIKGERNGSVIIYRVIDNRVEEIIKALQK